MKTFDLIVMCVRNLARRKFRTLLTVIGVVIGTCAIVVMISLGIGIQESQDAMMASFGDLTIIQVWSYSAENPLDDEAVITMQGMEGVDTATPFMRYYDPYEMNIFSGRKDRYKMDAWRVVGVYSDSLEKLGYELLDGQYLGEGKNPRKIYVLFGEQTAYQFEDTRKSWRNNRVFPYPDEYGNISDPFIDPARSDFILRLKTSGDNNAKELEYELEVIGTLKGDYGKSYETFNGVFMDIEDLKKIQADYMKATNTKISQVNNTGYDNVRVKTTSINNVAEVEAVISDEMGFDTYSMESERQQMQQNAQQVQMILGGLGAVSLFVAAISITNTMIMSVYERTREIGVMKVLGCLVGNIRAIFLIEAGLIGFLGGLLGIGVSYLLSFIMNTFGAALSEGALGGLLGGGYYYGYDSAAAISIIPPWLVAVGMGFATLIGLVSGFYPANRAVRISALEAIRQE